MNQHAMENEFLRGINDGLPFWNAFLRVVSLSSIPIRIHDSKTELQMLSHFQRIEVSGNDTSGVHQDDFIPCSEQLIKALTLRKKYMFSSYQSFPKVVSRLLYRLETYSFNGTTDEIKDTSYDSKVNKDSPSIGISEPGLTSHTFVMKNGVVHVYHKFNKKRKRGRRALLNLQYPKLVSFIQDYNEMVELINNGPLRSFCRTRLFFLSSRFDTHLIMNHMKESESQKILSGTDFYRVIKVDTHVHASGCINQIDLLEFMKKKIRDEEKKVYKNKKGKELNLRQVFEELDKDSKNMNIDLLDVHADRNTFDRFDIFNAKYNPLGQNQFREIFFKTDNFFKGTYFAEILKNVITNLKGSKYQKAEYRLSIYGRSKDEWQNLAAWAKPFLQRDNLKTVKWIIQVPRLYNVYRKSSNSKTVIKSFQEMLENIFIPLFEATSAPHLHADLDKFLKHVSGFDSVDDESKSESTPFTKATNPNCWTEEKNPEYAYYLYYMYANIVVLNNFRRHQNLHTFVFRPHCGEAGNPTHLVAGFLLAENISHGVMLKEVPVLEYLFYLSQIGIAMSPMSNNALFTKYQSNPLPEYFKRGLNISLSTDDPMQFHFTREPLIEEYSSAAMMWNLSSCDICEIARNSVLQSGFDHVYKQQWIGERYNREGIEANDATKTNVPSIRVAYRYDTLVDELSCISRGYLQPRRPCKGSPYTLSYFKKGGQEQVARLCFDVADVKANYKPKKTEAPLVLRFNGTRLTGTLVVDRFLAGQFGLFGNNDIERAKIDEVITKVSDVPVESLQIDDLYTEVTKILTYLDKTLNENPIKCGFVVGEKLSVADLTIFCFLDRLPRCVRTETKFPAIWGLKKKVKTYTEHKK